MNEAPARDGVNAGAFVAAVLFVTPPTPLPPTEMGCGRYGIGRGGVRGAEEVLFLAGQEQEPELPGVLGGDDAAEEAKGRRVILVGGLAVVDGGRHSEHLACRRGPIPAQGPSSRMIKRF